MDTDEALNNLEAKITAKQSGLRKAAFKLLTQLGWELRQSGNVYSMVDATGAKPLTVVSADTVQGVIGLVIRLFVHKHYLRLMTKDSEHFWAIKNISNTKSTTIAKELSGQYKKLGTKLSGSATVIYLDEDKQLYRDDLQSERFSVAADEDFKWSSGYVIITEGRFIENHKDVS